MGSPLLEPEKGSSSSSQNSPAPRGLLYTLLAAFAFLSGYFWSKSHTPISRSSDSINGHDSADDRTNDPSNHSTGRICIAKTDGPPSPPGCDYSKKEPKRWFKRWKPYVFLLNLATFIAVVWYACITHSMWKEMQQQTSISQKQLETADRPWLKETVTSTAPFLANNGAFSWGVIIRVTNVGHSVATGVFAPAILIAPKSGDYFDEPLAKLKDFCDKISNTRIDPSRYGVSIFPGDYADITASPILFPNDVNHASFDDRGNKAVEPMLVGCIDYQFPASEKRHQTRFIYDVFDKSKPSAQSVFIAVGKTVPKDQIGLVRHFAVGGEYAY
jgi:hypothetical protein